MAVHVISYDLNKQKNYERLFEAIRALGTWCHPVDSTWYVKSNYTSVQIRDHLTASIDSDDVLIVSEVSGVTAWSDSLSPAAKQWFIANL